MKGTGSLLWLFLLLGAAALAPGVAPASGDGPPVSVSAEISAEKIGLDDTLVYTLTFHNVENPAQPDLSLLDDFKLLQTSRSSEFQLRDGASTSSTRFTYYLMPIRTGRLELPAVRCSHQGQEYRTQAFVVEVVKGSLGANRAPAGKPSLFDDDFFAAPFAGGPQKVDAFLRAVVSKPACLKGEQILYRVLLYTRNRIEAVNMVSGASFSGFWQEWFPVPQSIAPTNANVDGTVYQVYEIRKAALFASESGTLTIPPLQFELQLADPGAAFFGARPLRRSTQEIKVQVGVPPADAAGLPVGAFTFALEPPAAKADVNEIITLRLAISGTGNCKAIIPPQVPGSAMVMVYPAKISQEAAYSVAALTGTLRAEVPLAFKTNGLAVIPGLEFRYYDPERRRVVALRSAALRIQVSGEKAASGLERTLPGSAIVQRGEDIEFIRSGPLRPRRVPMHRRAWYPLLIAALFAGNLLVLLKTRLWDRVVADSAPLRNRRILARALKRLDAVRSLEEIAPAMESYFCEKSGLGLAEVSESRIAATLAAAGVPRSSSDAFLFIKGQSELARFSAHKRSGLELKKDLKTLKELLREIDGKMNRP